MYKKEKDRGDVCPRQRGIGSKYSARERISHQLSSSTPPSASLIQRPSLRTSSTAICQRSLPDEAHEPFPARSCTLPTRVARLSSRCHFHQQQTWREGHGWAMDGRRPRRRKCGGRCQRPSRRLLQRGGRRGMGGRARPRDRARYQGERLASRSPYVTMPIFKRQKG